MRYISDEDYADISDDKKPRSGDVLVTMDGGTSIGKPALFELQGEYAIDSHVAILRPEGLDAKLLVYLLASPLGQAPKSDHWLSTLPAETENEDDLRRFRFPSIDNSQLDRIRKDLDDFHHEIASPEGELDLKRTQVEEYLAGALGL